uniref:Leucine zipper tumor suppressor 2 n=1 Tax=Gadus morhua TaxID=8049 RepID=A0A8C5FHB9_GADMO
MALVQPLPVSADHLKPGPGGSSRSRRSSGHASPVGPAGPPPPSLEAMGSVGSLIAPRPAPYHDRQRRTTVGGGPAGEPGARHARRATPGAGAGLGPDSPQDALLLLRRSPPPPVKRQSSANAGRTDADAAAAYAYLNEEYVEDWTVSQVTPPSLSGLPPDEVNGGGGWSGIMGGPPPKLVPISGKLEMNMDNAVLRPTAFKPVVPKSRSSMQYLSPRHGPSSQSGSQNNLNLLSPSHTAGEATPSCSDKRSSYGSRGQATSQSCSMSDSGRTSLSSLPPYPGPGYSQATSEASGGHLEPVKAGGPGAVNGHGHGHGHGHSNSDSGRSSSSKSTGSGSLGGRGQPLSDNGSAGRSPGPLEGYEGVVRDLEDKLRERELELQQLRDNLDENEAAICQVYEEKQKRCELELEELRQGCATRMQTASQKSQRAQQVLQLQVCQKSGEISLLKQQLKDVQGELAQRVGEIVSLRGQLRDARGELTNGQALLQEAHANGRTRTLELEVCENELQRRKSEVELLRDKAARLEEELARLRDALAGQGQGQNQGQKHQNQNQNHNQNQGARRCQVFQEAEEHLLAYESDEGQAQRQAGGGEALQGMRLQMDRMRAELTRERQRAEEQVGGFQEERRVWQEEKDKVIHYQKQLQHNYVEMYRRNQELECALRELSQELDSREEEDEGSGNEIHFDEVAATEI